MAEHRLDDALAWAQNALALGSGDSSPWAIAGDALADVGDYSGAAEAYSKLDRALMAPRTRSWLSPTSGTAACHFFGSLRAIHRAPSSSCIARYDGDRDAHARREYRLEPIPARRRTLPDGQMAGAADRPISRRSMDSPGTTAPSQGSRRSASRRASFGKPPVSFRKQLRRCLIPNMLPLSAISTRNSAQPQEASKEYALVEFIGYLSRNQSANPQP